MKITTSGGTDAGGIILFWPDNLSDDDARLRDDPVALVDELDREGKLVRFPCDADGDYSLTVFLDEPIPSDLRKLCTDEREYRALLVKEDGYFGGIEYLAKRGHTPKQEGVCGSIRIPAGSYRAIAYRTEVGDELYDQWMRDHVPPAARRLAAVQATTATLTVMTLVATVVSLFLRAWQTVLLLAGLAVALGVISVVLSMTKAYQRVARAKADFETEYPTYVLHLI